jgi:DNA polymerase-4
VQLKVRFGDFTTITRSRTLPEPTDLAADVGAVARDLLHQVDVGPGVRLLGISAQQLVRSQSEVEDQGTLFAAEPEEPDGAPDPASARPPEGPGEPRREAALERSVDEVRARFGPGAVGHGAARSLPGEGPGRPTR